MASSDSFARRSQIRQMSLQGWCFCFYLWHFFQPLVDKIDSHFGCPVLRSRLSHTLVSVEPNMTSSTAKFHLEKFDTDRHPIWYNPPLPTYFIQVLIFIGPEIRKGIYYISLLSVEIKLLRWGIFGIKFKDEIFNRFSSKCFVLVWYLKWNDFTSYRLTEHRCC